MKESIEERCLEIWGVYGSGPIHLKIHREKGFMDLHPLFKDVFKVYDYLFDQEIAWKNDDDPNQRYEESPEKSEFVFEFREFVGAFARAYKIEEISSFLEENIIKDDDQAKSFIKQFKNFEEKYRTASVRFCGRNCIVIPHGFGVDVLNDLIPKRERRWNSDAAFLYINKKIDGKAGSSRPLSIKYISSLQHKLYSLENPIILCNSYGPSLNYYNMICSYDIKKELYKIVRISNNQEKRLI